MADVTRALHDTADEYRAHADDDRPLGGYLGLLGLYSGGFGILALLGRSRLPGTLSASDLALGAIATHKLSRIITEEPITSPPARTGCALRGHGRSRRGARGGPGIRVATCRRGAADLPVLCRSMGGDDSGCRNDDCPAPHADLHVGTGHGHGVRLLAVRLREGATDRGGVTGGRLTSPSVCAPCR